MDIKELNKALTLTRICLNLPDDLPIDGCKEPEYAGGRACILRALVDHDLVSKDDAMIWFRTYAC